MKKRFNFFVLNPLLFFFLFIYNNITLIFVKAILLKKKSS